MKTYTFTLSKNNNSAETYKNELMKRVITAYPWLTIDSKFDYPKSDIGIEYASAGDLITLGLSNKHNVSWIPCNCAKCPFINDTTNFDLETEFPLAMQALKAYAEANKPFDSEYDFEDMFGTPIKFFDYFVQIGYDIIPFEIGTIKNLKPKTKKTIINIIIKIKNNGLY